MKENNTANLIYINITKPFPDWQVYYLDVDKKAHVSTVQDLKKIVTKNSEVFILVPNEKVSLYVYNLPKLSAKEFATAIAFELEEKLAEPPDSLHFAQTFNSSEDHKLVAVVNRQLMQEWQTDLLQNLSEFQDNIKLMTTEGLLLPVREKQWSMIELNDKYLLRISEKSILTIHNSNAEGIISLILQQNQGDLALEMVMYVTKKPSFIEMFKDFKIDCQIVKDPFVTLIQNCPSPNTINLLQGEFSTMKEKAQQEHLLKKLLLVGVICAVVFTGFLSAQYLWLNAQLTKTKTAIQTIYFNLYPKKRFMLNPKRTLQNELSEYQDYTTTKNLMGYLVEISNILTTIKDIKINSITYEKNQLFLNLIASNYNEFNEFKQKLTNINFIIKDEKVKRQGQIIKASLELNKV